MKVPLKGVPWKVSKKSPNLFASKTVDVTIELRLKRRGKMPALNHICIFHVSIINVKPATHLAILYADCGEFDRQRNSQRFSPPIDADTLGDFFRRSWRRGSFEKVHMIKSPNLMGWLYWRFAAMTVDNRRRGSLGEFSRSISFPGSLPFTSLGREEERPWERGR